MKIKYGVLNPLTGETDRFDSKAEAMQVFWKRMYEIAIEHFHSTAYVIINENDDGSELWYNDQSEPIARILSNAEIEANITELLASRKSQGTQTL